MSFIHVCWLRSYLCVSYFFSHFLGGGTPSMHSGGVSFRGCAYVCSQSLYFIHLFSLLLFFSSLTCNLLVKHHLPLLVTCRWNDFEWLGTPSSINALWCIMFSLRCTYLSPFIFLCHVSFIFTHIWLVQI